MAEILDVNALNFEKKLLELGDALKKGCVAALPSETSYGLACSIEFPKSIKRIHDIKKQPYNKPISVIVDGLKTIEKYAELNDYARKLVNVFMPGPLTLIVKAKDNVPELLSQETIAFRISSNNIYFKLCWIINRPLTATSANISGEKEIYDSEKIKELFSDKVDYIVDAGKLKKKKPSTIFDVENKRVLREGEIKEEQILEVLKGEDKSE